MTSKTIQRGEKNGRSKFLNSDIIAIRARAANGEKMLTIAKDYRVSDAAIRHIIKRRRWAHIERSSQ